MFAYGKWRVARGLEYFQAVLPFLPGKEGGSALHPNATAKKSKSGIFPLLPKAQRSSLQKSWLLSETRRAPGPSSHAVLLFSGTAGCPALKLRSPKRGHPGTSLDRSLAHSQQPGSWGRVAGPVPGLRKEGSYRNIKEATAAHAVTITAFWEPSQHLIACQHDPHSLFACPSWK